VVSENVLAEGLPLDLPSTLPARSLEPKVNPADPGEERSEGGHSISLEQC
jgi:hypothetical protein